MLTPARLSLQPALEDSVSHEVDATGDVESSHCVCFVDLDGLDAQRNAGGDLFVAVAERDEAQNFRLTVCQTPFCFAARGPVAIVVHDFGGELRVDVFPTSGD